MVTNPTFIKINGKRYNINTDFRVAIKCIEVASDDEISDFERALAIIYLLYGEEGINSYKDYEMLLEMAKKYLNCGKELTEETKEPDMDFIQDMPLIETSFMSDYNIDLSNTKMHWWKFYNRLNGLSCSDIGNCCVLNRVRNLRTMDINKITDNKEKEELRKAKEYWSLNKESESNKSYTDEELESMERFRQQMEGV